MPKPPVLTVEIRKAGFVNKGAELMLHAVVEAVSGCYPGVRLVMTPSGPGGSQPVERFTALGLLPKLGLRYCGVEWGGLGRLVPRRLRARFGLVLDREVDVVLDAAGFAYSDQWGLEPLRELDQSLRRWQRRGTRVVLLPQAFGPFDTPVSQQLVRRIVERADLVLPRDERSEASLVAITGPRANLQRFPDFTCLVEPAAMSTVPTAGRACLVPNARMVDRNRPDQAAAYVPFFARVVPRLIDAGLSPCILLHEDDASERRLAEQVSAACGGLEVLHEPDPRRLKAMIGQAAVMVGSRFHGLVSALSQGVPAVATGWSHKYRALFDEYGFPEGLLATNCDDAALDHALSHVLQSGRRDLLVEKLRATAEQQKQATRQMWARVFAVIDTVPVRRV